MNVTVFGALLSGLQYYFNIKIYAFQIRSLKAMHPEPHHSILILIFIVNSLKKINNQTSLLHHLCTSYNNFSILNFQFYFSFSKDDKITIFPPVFLQKSTLHSMCL